MSTNFPFLNLDTTLDKDSTPGKKLPLFSKLRGSKQMFLLPSSSLRELPNNLGLPMYAASISERTRAISCSYTTT